MYQYMYVYIRNYFNVDIRIDTIKLKKKDGSLHFFVVVFFFLFIHMNIQVYIIEMCSHVPKLDCTIMMLPSECVGLAISN